MRKYLYPCLALLLGGAGCALRRWQLATCFDENGLPVPGRATELLIALTVCGVVCFLLLTQTRRTAARDWLGAFGPGPRLELLPGGVLYLAAGAAYVLWTRQSEPASSVFRAINVVLPVVLGAALFLSGAAVCLLARRGAAEPLAAMAPGFCSCFWLIQIYHTNANDPVVQVFVWQLLAAVASVAAWYYLAGFSLGIGKGRTTLFWSMTAVTLSLVALADDGALFTRLLLAAQVVCLPAQLPRLAAGMEHAGRTEPRSSSQEAADL
ncbi:MAG: hypothetical protein LUG65_01630 [Clostridiales bacterium]|nr:hypothetical protein [Clostridiales bacterium]